ncbi:MAG: hypothetical protein HYZ28_23485 [Myxococcales bacterium]|nr:hypothetical protein [Myxococcales bacterium]
MRFTWTPTVDHYHAWASHFRQKGWLERPFDYTRDEPPQGCSWSQITSRASLVRSGDPELKTLVTTSLQEAATLTCHWLWRKTGQELPLFVAELGGECRVGIHQ